MHREDAREITVCFAIQDINHSKTLDISILRSWTSKHEVHSLSLVLPFALLLRRTRLPLGVDILFNHPCFLFLCSVLG